MAGAAECVVSLAPALSRYAGEGAQHHVPKPSSLACVAGEGWGEGHA
jgi:hypothetical protein